MSEEHTAVDRNDPELKYLTVEKNQFNDPATQAEWTQKRLVWVPHETQVCVCFWVLSVFACESSEPGTIYIYGDIVLYTFSYIP